MSSQLEVGKQISSPTSVYTVEELLGSGSFGQVVLCRQVLTREPVVVKAIVRETKLSEAQQEAQTLRELQALGSEKTNIVKFHGSFIFNEIVFLEFEKLDMNLLEYATKYPLSLPQFRAILKQVVEGVSFLHEYGYIHADLKPENIMVVDHLQKPPRVKIIDFGETIVESPKWRGYILQTLYYRAPEVVLGLSLTKAIDVWSLACTVIELLSGEILFNVAEDDELMDCMVSIIGMPPQHMLRAGWFTKTYFFRKNKKWFLKSSGSCPANQNLSAKLYNLLNKYRESSAEEKHAADFDLSSFVNLLVNMLNMDPRHRISINKMLQDLFFTLIHHTDSCNSNLETSEELLKSDSSRKQSMMAEIPSTCPKSPSKKRKLDHLSDSEDPPIGPESPSKKRKLDLIGELEAFPSGSKSPSGKRKRELSGSLEAPAGVPESLSSERKLDVLSNSEDPPRGPERPSKKCKLDSTRGTPDCRRGRSRRRDL